MSRARARSTCHSPKHWSHWVLSPFLLFSLSCMEETPGEAEAREEIGSIARRDRRVEQRSDWDEIDDDGGTQIELGAPGGEDGPGGTAPATLARLTRRQYRNIIRDVFGPEIVVTTVLEEETPLHGFASVGVRELTLSPLAVEQYEQAAQEVTGQLFDAREGWRSLIPCGELEAIPGDCVADALSRLGRRLWRQEVESALD